VGLLGWCFMVWEAERSSSNLSGGASDLQLIGKGAVDADASERKPTGSRHIERHAANKGGFKGLWMLPVARGSADGGTRE
jgi:hypothetical protein